MLVTFPVVPITATEVLSLLHTPPVVASLNIVDVVDNAVVRMGDADVW